MTRKMGVRFAGWTWCALVALAVPARAHAQSDAPVPRAAETDGERAGPFFQEGIRAADQKQWAAAEAAYLKAWAIAQTFDIAANLGIVELKLGKPRLAAVHLAFSLRTAPPSAKAPVLNRTRQLLAQAKQQIGVLRVRVSVPDAVVSIDDVPLKDEESLAEIFVEPGTHRVVAEAVDHLADIATVTVQAGSSQEVMLSLAPLPPMPVQRPEAKGDVAEVPAQPAGHQGEHRSWVPAIALGAASVVALGVGVGTTVASNNASGDVDAQKKGIVDAGGQCVKPSDAFAGRCAEIQRTGLRADNFGNAARVAYVAAGALALATVAYVVWPSLSPKAPARVGARLDLRHDGAGFGVVGTW